jgi:sugar O-acyltransferase (sialic acid O-acetyltransferase NeuD family)
MTAEKRRPLVIFGMGDMGEVAHHYFETDSDYEVVAFTADRAYCGDRSEFRGRPIVAFEELEARFSPDGHDLFVALGYSELNAARQRKVEEARRKGYTLATYVSTRATVLNEGRIGANCFILEDNTIQPFVEIGDNVVLWSGNHIGHHAHIGDHCFIASHVVVSGRVRIGERCFIGVNVTIRDNVQIGPRCVLGAGTLLLADAEAEGVYSADATPRSRVPSSRLRKI